MDCFCSQEWMQTAVFKIRETKKLMNNPSNNVTVPTLITTANISFHWKWTCIWVNALMQHLWHFARFLLGGVFRYDVRISLVWSGLHDLCVVIAVTVSCREEFLHNLQMTDRAVRRKTQWNVLLCLLRHQRLLIWSHMTWNQRTETQICDAMKVWNENVLWKTQMERKKYVCLCTEGRKWHWFG